MKVLTLTSNGTENQALGAPYPHASVLFQAEYKEGVCFDFEGGHTLILYVGCAAAVLIATDFNREFHTHRPVRL